MLTEYIREMSSWIPASTYLENTIAARFSSIIIVVTYVAVFIVVRESSVEDAFITG